MKWCFALAIQLCSHRLWKWHSALRSKPCSLPHALIPLCICSWPCHIRPSLCFIVYHILVLIMLSSWLWFIQPLLCYVVYSMTRLCICFALTISISILLLLKWLSRTNKISYDMHMIKYNDPFDNITMTWIAWWQNGQTENLTDTCSIHAAHLHFAKFLGGWLRLLVYFSPSVFCFVQAPTLWYVILMGMTLKAHYSKPLTVSLLLFYHMHIHSHALIHTHGDRTVPTIWHLTAITVQLFSLAFNHKHIFTHRIAQHCTQINTAPNKEWIHKEARKFGEIRENDFHRKFLYPGSFLFTHYISKTYGSRLFCLHNHHITTEHITRILSCKIQNAPILAYIKFSQYSISFHQWSIFSGTNDVVHSPTHYAHCARVKFIPGQVPVLSQHHPVV